MTKILLLKNKLALRRIRKCLTAEKAKLLANAFINSQFSYAPLIWMFANKSSIDKILKIHKRTLQIVYDVYDESMKILNRSDDISIHQKHIRYLAIEVYKSLTKLNPGFMWNFFERNLTIYDEVTYYFYRQLNLFAMVLIL